MAETETNPLRVGQRSAIAARSDARRRDCEARRAGFVARAVSGAGSRADAAEARAGRALVVPLAGPEPVGVAALAPVRLAGARPEERADEHDPSDLTLPGLLH